MGTPDRGCGGWGWWRAWGMALPILLAVGCATTTRLNDRFDPLEGRLRMDDPLPSPLQPARLGRTSQGAYPASDAESGVDPRGRRLLRSAASIGDDGDRVDGASLGALSARSARVIADRGDVVRGHDAVGVAVLADGQERGAATLAALADEPGVPPDVVHVEDEPHLPRLGEALLHLGSAHLARQVVPDHEICRASQGGAFFQGDLACLRSQMQLLVPARAEPDGKSVRLPEQLRCPLVIEHLQALRRLQSLFMRQGPHDLDLHASAKVRRAERAIDLEIVVEELGPHLGVQARPRAHHGELEDPDHHRGGDVVIGFAEPDIDDQPLGGQGVQDLPEGSLLVTGGPHQLGERGEPVRHSHDDIRFLCGVQLLQDRVQRVVPGEPHLQSVELPAELPEYVLADQVSHG